MGVIGIIILIVNEITELYTIAIYEKVWKKRVKIINFNYLKC